MKKIGELVKPYISIVFGALLFLLFLNKLSATGETLALAIIAVILSGYYVCSGILGVVLGDKLPAGLRNVFDILNVTLFPTFFFVSVILSVSEFGKYMGPTAWVINIFAMMSAPALVGTYIASKFVKHKVVVRLSVLFAMLFILSLVLNLLFNALGGEIALGELPVVTLLCFVAFAVLLFNSFSKKEVEPEQVE